MKWNTFYSNNRAIYYFNDKPNKVFIKTDEGAFNEAKFCPSCGKELPVIQKFLRIQ